MWDDVPSTSAYMANQSTVKKATRHQNDEDTLRRCPRPRHQRSKCHSLGLGVDENSKIGIGIAIGDAVKRPFPSVSTKSKRLISEETPSEYIRMCVPQPLTRNRIEYNPVQPTACTAVVGRSRMAQESESSRSPIIRKRMYVWSTLRIVAQSSKLSSPNYNFSKNIKSPCA